MTSRLGMVSFLALCLGSASLEVVQAGDDAAAPLALFRFNGNAKNEGRGDAKFELKNAPFKDNALYLNGKYEFDADKKDAFHAVCLTPMIDYQTYTVALRVRAEDFGLGDKSNLFTGGNSYRWFGLERALDGKLVVTLNNGAFKHEIKDTALDKGKWFVVACSVDVPKRSVLTYLNGKQVAAIDLPKDFEVEVLKSDQKDSDKVWSFSNLSNANVFFGLADELHIYGRALSAKELEKLPLRP